MQRKHHRRRNSIVVRKAHRTPLWHPYQNHLGQRPQISCNIHKRTMHDIRYKTKYQFSESSTNGRTERKDQSTNGTVSPHSNQQRSKGLGTMGSTRPIRQKLMDKQYYQKNPLRVNIRIYANYTPTNKDNRPPKASQPNGTVKEASRGSTESNRTKPTMTSQGDELQTI